MESRQIRRKRRLHPVRSKHLDQMSPPGWYSLRIFPLLHTRYVARPIGHRFVPAAPSRVHAVRRALQDGFDTPDLFFFELEHLGQLPGPRRRRARGHLAAVGRLEVARVAGHVVEEDEAEDESPLLIDGDVPAVADAGHEME